MTDDDAKKLLTFADLKRKYDLGRTYTYKLIRDGDLEAVKVGRKTMFTPEAVERWRTNLPRFNLRNLPVRR